MCQPAQQPQPQPEREHATDTTADAGDADGDVPGASYRSMPLRMAGVEIVELRQSVGWSQSELAARICYPQRQVSRWERGEQVVSQEACTAILRAVERERLSAEEARLARYQLRRWMRRVHCVSSLSIQV